MGMEGSQTPVGFVVLTKLESVKILDTLLRIIVHLLFIFGILLFIFISNFFNYIYITFFSNANNFSKTFNVKNLF